MNRNECKWCNRTLYPKSDHKLKIHKKCAVTWLNKRLTDIWKKGYVK